MSRRRNCLGADPACRERQVVELERRLRIYLRLWRLGPGGQCQVWNDVALLLGPRRGRDALKALERYWAALADASAQRRTVCLCHAAELTALIVGRIAAGDRSTAARLLRHVAPASASASAIEQVIGSAEAVAAAFLDGRSGIGDAAADGGRAGARPSRSSPEQPEELPKTTHEYRSQILKH